MEFSQGLVVARKTPSFVLVVALLVVAATLTSHKSFAQLAGVGSIQGTVLDPSGAVIAKAQVTITDQSTGVRHATVSNSGGLFSFPNLNVGTYTLSATASGFKAYTQSNIVLEVGSSIGINVKMEVGAASQEVQVHAEGLALQTQDVNFKQTIDQRTITALPLNGRQVTSLITLSGGSAPAPKGDMIGSKNFYSSIVVSVAGGQGDQTDYRLNGGDHNDYMTNVNLPFPFPDAVNQFSVETTAMGAQSGLHPGGQVNVVTRSGSNQWHGSAFEFIRNNYVDATNFFSSTKDSLHQNQFGGTLGGKIIANKLFFFGGYQRTVANSSTSATQAHVPTAANMRGDFSVTDGAGCTSNRKAIQLLNPLTGAILPGDQIDPSAFAAPALALQKMLPTTSDPCGLVFYAIPSETSANQYVGRVDWTISQKDSLYGAYFMDGYLSPAFFSPTNILLTTKSGNDERAQSLTIGETHVFNPTTVNALHLTATRRRDNRGGASQGINGKDLGINMYSPDPNFLRVSLSNKWSIYCGTCAFGNFNVNSFSVSDDVTMVRGKHQIAFGGDFTRAQLNVNNHAEMNGVIGFTGVYSQKGPSGTSTGGTGADANLDFLMGAMNSFEQSKASQNALRAPIPSLYVQDTYHATKKVVLTAGLRWAPEFMPTDYFGRGSTFDMTSFINNVHSKVFPNAPAGSFFYGDKGVPKNFTENSPWQFSPRLGATYDPLGNGQTVFRVGGALVYDETSFFTAQRTNQNPPFATQIANVPVGQPLNFADPWSNGSTVGDPFPLPFKPPADTQFPNQGRYAVLPKHFHPPYVMQWTASVQQELARGWQFQLDYMGNKSSFLGYGYVYNPAIYIPGTCGGKPCSTLGNTASRFALTIANPAQGPKYLGGGDGIALVASGANANYNGMVATIQHRMSSTFTFLANYTWSHCTDIQDAPGDFHGTTLENPHDVNMDKGNCGFDHRNMFNMAMVASSHFPWTGWKAQFFNNWEFAPLIRFTDGTPFNVTTGVDNSLTDINQDRPNLISGANAYTNRTPTAKNANNSSIFISRDAFTPNATGTYGNLGRNAFRGPKDFELDAAVSRSFPLRDRLSLLLRFEGFNVPNHPNFDNPNGSLASANFGRITGSGDARVFQLAAKLIF